MSVAGMTVAVTGGAGYLGSAVSPALLFAGARVRIVDRLLFGAAPIAGLLRHPACSLMVGDVRDETFLREAFAGADAVVHLAAIVGESACAIDEAAAWEINCEGTRIALEASERAGAGVFLFASTCSNYGIAEEAMATERTPLHPLSQYARAKVEAERYVLRARRPGCVMRFGTLCGLSARMRFDLLVNEVARAAATGQPIEMFGLDAWRPLLDVEDAVRAIETALGAPPAAISGQIFNAASENVQKKELVELVRRHFPGTPVRLSNARPDPRNYRVDTERVRDVLGYAPARTIEQSFLALAKRVAEGFFRDPFSPEHSALPPRPLDLAPRAIRSSTAAS